MTIEAFRLFDNYGLRAQLFPAIIAGLPSLGFILALVPWDHMGLPHAIASVMVTVLLFAFADLARRYGRKVEARLGTRSTPEIFFRDNSLIDEPSKARYRAFLAKKVGIPAPSEDDETKDPDKAKSFYRSAATWLRENTRDTKKFKLLFNEVVTYGFRRNLLGLKYLSLSLNFIVLISCALVLYVHPPYFMSLSDVDAKLWVVVIAAILHSLYMGFGVNNAAVIEASQVYGRQLVISCEAFIAGNQPSARQSTRRPAKAKSEDN
jgi:hypothetical protein